MMATPLDLDAWLEGVVKSCQAIATVAILPVQTTEIGAKSVVLQVDPLYAVDGGRRYYYMAGAAILPNDWYPMPQFIKGGMRHSVRFSRLAYPRQFQITFLIYPHDLEGDTMGAKSEEVFEAIKAAIDSGNAQIVIGG